MQPNQPNRTPANSAPPFSPDSEHPTEEQRKQDFLVKVASPRYDRGGVSGLKRYAEGKVDASSAHLYSTSEARKLIELGIEDRMKVKISDHYNALVTGDSDMPPSAPLRNLVTARGEEVKDLSGEVDPSNQLSYSPAAGILHKYEMALLYVVKTCSAHCRYCYRLDLFTGKSGKPLAQLAAVRDYIDAHNEAAAANHGFHPETGRPTLREVLLSGGDPMVLSNTKLAAWLIELAEAGISTIRIGTKELAFFPHRFDDDFFGMLDAFNEAYPNVRLVFAVHFTHPDEFLIRDDEGAYVTAENDHRFMWLAPVENAVEQLTRRRHFISLENQTPIIRDVNNDAHVLKILQQELYAHGIGNHYYFQCRQIEGHKAFAVPVEECWQLFTDSQRHLSGVEAHARFVMSTEQGKVEVCGVSGEPDDGYVVFKWHRNPGAAAQRGQIAIARRNPQALWINDYQDRVFQDPEGLIGSTE
ncbi:hypothetical protein [Actomonas aquatica]|uniref:Radical SAM protein n=1 Tax=Actomonas aquatica TaxID=2866162 RepID=A0ABZ1CB45_9BACT|nr:hypothetical protein [Opitutus sp. WL0086]WRQ87525.1 hypothetical protein K1X11_022140 [Opitutus sp. WL0086]